MRAGDGIATQSDVAHHKKQRELVQPAFTNAFLATQIPTFAECAINFAKLLASQA